MKTKLHQVFSINNVRTIILFAFIAINFTFHAQTNISLSETINWKIDKSNLEIIDFENKREYILPDTYIDSYYKRIKLDGYYTSSSAIISNTEEGPFNSERLMKNQIANINSDYKVYCKIIHLKNKDFLDISVIPLRKHGAEIKKLLSFDLQITNTIDTKNHYARGSEKTVSSSVLGDGSWYKIAIAKDGVYKINRSFLTELGIDVNSLNPQQLNIYGNGGELLPVENSVIVNNETKYDDLQKNSIVVTGENDNSFDQGDYILFYGKGPEKWELNGSKFYHTKHYYSDSAYYYIRVDDTEPKRIENFSTSESAATHISDKFQDHYFIENNSVNLIHSGRNFVGDEFNDITSRNYSFNIPNITNDPIDVDFNLFSRSIGTGSSFSVSHNGNQTEVSISSVGTSSTSNYANTVPNSLTTSSTSETVIINFNYTKANPAAVGWIDYLRVNASRDLKMTGSQMHFRDINNIGIGNISEYNLTNAGSLKSVWNISDLANVSSINDNLLGSEVVFKVSTESLHEYIAFTNSNYLEPRAVGQVANQNLHALSDIQYVIVTSPLLKDQAEEIANLHREEGLTVEVVTPMEVYNEFSSGNPDVTAIKLFMKHLYDNASNDESRLKYLMLFGDAAFNRNKGVQAINSFNVICYESHNSVSPVYSYVSDDYFTLLDDDAGEHPSDFLRIGVGRIPASSVLEAEQFVNKIKIYTGVNTAEDGGAACLGDESSSSFGPWRNLLVFVTDDQDGNYGATERVHMNTANTHSNKIYSEHNEFNVIKLYMDAYNQISTPGGERYPEGELAIKNRVQDGALLVTYIGHGGEKGWAHERILNTTTIQNWSNINRLPVFFTATCELARFDNPFEKSAGEMMIMNPLGGGIAMLTTTRIVFSALNEDLGEAFFDIVLENDSIQNLALGDILKYTKNQVQATNTKNFSLLGDPALIMNYPKKKVFTTDVDNYSTELLGIDTLVPDTIKALQEVTVKGIVADENGDILSDFNGFVYPSVYDKKNIITTQNNDDAENEYSYDVFNSIIYRGKASVINGEFSFTFIIPKDINFSPGTARISYYAVDGSLDANGEFEKFVVGGILDDVTLNKVGPELELYLNDTTFVFGGVTNEAPVLIAKIRDENGINTTGNGIGHDIKGIIDNQISNSLILNENYESDLDTYKSGQIRFQMDELTEGTHNISLKVWDVHNNSSEAYTEFVVTEEADVALEHVLNYPNPFTTHTDFYFEHNQACQYLDVQVQIFTISGKIVKTINQTIETSGFRSDPIGWDGRDDFGDRIGRGVYVYRVKLRTPEGKTTEKFEKLVLLK